MRKLSSVLVGSALALCSLQAIGGAPAAHARPDAARSRVEDGERTYRGIVAQHGYRSGKNRFVRDYFFRIPDAVARDVSVGDVLVPLDPEYQRIVFVGDGVGYCIDSHDRPASARVAYRFDGMRDPEAAAVAIDLRRQGRAAYRAVWASRRGRE